MKGASTVKHAQPGDLATAVEQVIDRSSLAGRLKGVDIDSSEFDTDENFIRVLIRINKLEEISDDDLDNITSSIETELSKKDDRFPSVRFAEP